jgi:hypothetical protein
MMMHHGLTFQLERDRLIMLINANTTLLGSHALLLGARISLEHVMNFEL